MAMRLAKAKSSGVLTEVMDLMKDLTPDELLRAQLHAQALLTLSGVGPTANAKLQAARPHHDVLDTILEVGRSLGIGGYFKQLELEARKPDIEQKLTDLENYLSQVHNKTQRILLLRIGLQMVHAHLTWMELPVTVVTLLRGIHHIPALIDRHFPGYARFGMLGLIVGGKPNAQGKDI